MFVTRYIPVVLLGFGLTQLTVAQVQVKKPVEENIPDAPIKVDKPVAAAKESQKVAGVTESAVFGAAPQKGLSLDDLRKDPAKLELILNNALVSRRWDVVEELLPLYREQAGADKTMIDYAEGSLYREKGEIGKAIDVFRRLIAEHPDSTRIRMELAILLFADQQNVAAKDQFRKVRAEDNNGETQKVIDKYLDEIDKRSKWNFSGGLSYLQDDNINNASDSKTLVLGDKVFEKTEESLPQKARGIQLSASASKDFNISGSHYWTFDTGFDGKWYHNKSQYNDVSIDVKSGYRFKSVDSSWSVQPLFRYRNVAGNTYSNKYALQADYAHWFNPNWQLSLYTELGREHYLASHSNETQWFNSVNLLYAPEASRYFFGGLNYYNVNADTDEASSYRIGASIGWNQDWGKGISTRWSMALARKTHKGEAWWGDIRKDTEFTNSLTLWNRDWHVGGITPKLTWTYRNVDSNFDELYSYDKHNIYLKFDKTF